MKHHLDLKVRIRYVWMGVAIMILLGIALFYLLQYYQVKYGVRDIIVYVAGSSATMTLFYHAFSLEYQIKAQRANTNLLRAKYTYDVVYQWSHPNMRECVMQVRDLLHHPDRIKELQDVTKIDDFASYLSKNLEKRSYLVQNLNYFESIATMIETEHIDVIIIKKAFKSLFISYYMSLRNYIDHRQKEYPDSWFYYEKISKSWIEEARMA